MEKKISLLLYGVLCFQSSLLYCSFNTADSETYSPFIRAEFEHEATRLIHMKTLCSFKTLKGDMSAYEALRNGLIIAQVVKNDTVKIPGPLDSLLDSKKAVADFDREGPWRKFIEGKRDGLNTTELTSDELKALVDYETKKMSAGNEVTMLVCSPDSKSDEAESPAYGKKVENLKESLKKNTPGVTVLLVALREREKNPEGAIVQIEGDWIALVVKSYEIAKKPKRIYFVADIGGASPPLPRTEKVLNLLKYLEGPSLILKKLPSIDTKYIEKHPLWNQVASFKINNHSEMHQKVEKIIKEHEARLKAERKQLTFGGAAFYGLTTGLVLLGGYIWLKHKYSNTRLSDTAQHTTQILTT